jgi:hypothetical protein
LDPRISYEAFRDEFEDDDELLTFLEASKNQLHAYYHMHYADSDSTPSQSNNPDEPSPVTIDGSPQKNFTARFRRRRVPVDELIEFWKTPARGFRALRSN